MRLPEKVIAALKEEPGQKAVDLASALGVDRKKINAVLYGPLKGKVEQDRSYRWSVISDTPSQAIRDADQQDTFANTPLARLCRYYLACLGYDDTGVSTFLTSNYGDPDYIEIANLPKGSHDLAESAEARQLLARKRTERGRFGLYVGYPTHANLIRSKRSSWKGYVVEPILLFPIEQHEGTGKLTIDLSFPIINQKPFQAFTNVEREMLMNELVQLEQELGLGGEGERPDLDEVAMRLQAIRPEWPWAEDIDPEALDDERPPMTEIDKPGIYNRAVVIMAEKSPFTQGLEKELRDLAQIPEAKYSNTALGKWLGANEKSVEPDAEMAPLIEVLPMNTEQRQAVTAGLTKPVTIITGPPGTGKSQVVTNLVVNAAWSGKRVLFASKNNKAVDVVETRVNTLGPRPVLLRVGAQAYQARLAEYVLALMASTATRSEHEDFEEAKKLHTRLLEKFSALTTEAEKLIDLRNKLDRLEQLAEEGRELLGDNVFSQALGVDTKGLSVETDMLQMAVKCADRRLVGAFSGLLWPLLRSRRFNRLKQVLSQVGSSMQEIEVELPHAPIMDEDLVSFEGLVDQIREKLSSLETAQSYLEALKEFQSQRPLEEIARAEAEILEKVASHSSVLWNLWLRLQPARMSAVDRQQLGKYTSVMKMVVEAGEAGKLSKQVYGKYADLLRRISHMLPCWAVTSLSAKGRIPLEPGVFDIVIFDEASQCDIASALPLLYRAKSVVIIGDPKQLSHISGLQRGQDQTLLEKFDLIDEFPHWAYSYQSLFGLGATQVSGEEVVSLVDHHRSHAHIIEFSNREFYEERLRVATKYSSLSSPSRGEPGIRWVDVKGHASQPAGGGAINMIEANCVIETLRDLVLTKGYQGTVGVVTPFRAQANAITQLVNKDETLSNALIQRGFLADTVHKFQGDERDVMFFSPVVSQGLPRGSLGFLKANGNLFNVAITRARAQLIVIGDKNACATSEIGYLSRFAYYVAELSDYTSGIEYLHKFDASPEFPNVSKPELVSDWEKYFYTASYRSGLRLIPQYPVEKYIVDFLMVSGDRKLAIEIDGERYHRNWTGELCRRDQLRNQRLFELGYDVMRFWVYEVRDDLEGCIDKIKSWERSEVK